LTDLLSCLLRSRRGCRCSGASLSLWDRGSTRGLFGCFSLRRTVLRSIQWPPLRPAPKSVRHPRRGRHCFALDLVPLQSLVRISRRDDLRRLLARLLDFISLGAACLHRSIVCTRTHLYRPHPLPPPLRLP